MMSSMHGSTTVSNIGVAMFTVADQDAARAFYTEKLGWEVRGDDRFGEDGAMRWLEVAPPGSTARLALNAPMRDEPGGGSIGVETPDVRAEHERLSAVDGVTIDTPPMEMGGAPLMFSVADPDGNHIWVVQTPPAS
jgi:predicted enzyme related to lactoylglutathione lyase